MDHSTLSHDTQKLIERKNALLSSFSDSEDRIARKISHLPQSEATFVMADTPHDPIDQLFDEAVEKAERRQKTDDEIIGYHTEEILGVEEALLALKQEKAFSSPDLAEVESLLNQAEDLIDTMPDNRYIAARAAVDKMVLDNNPLKKKKNARKRSSKPIPYPETSASSDTEEAPSPSSSHVSDVQGSKISTRLSQSETERTTTAEPSEYRKDSQETQKEAVFSPNPSSKLEFLALFISLLTFTLFLALLAPVMTRLDYLALLILVIFMILTLDMSYQSVLLTCLLLIVIYTAGFIREVLIGTMSPDVLHFGWFIFIPFCLISAARFIKKAFPKDHLSSSCEENTEEEQL